MQFFISFHFHHTENVKYEVYSTTTGFSDGQLNVDVIKILSILLLLQQLMNICIGQSHTESIAIRCSFSVFIISLWQPHTFVSTSIFYHPLSKPSRHPQSPSITAAVFQTCTPPSPGSCSLFNYAVYPQVQDFSLFLFCIPLLSLHLALSLSSSP